MYNNIQTVTHWVQIIYRSPWRRENTFHGNSCRQTMPITPVSSSALYLDLDLSASPAKMVALLQYTIFITVHMYTHYHTYFWHRPLYSTITLNILSTLSWSKNTAFSCRGERTLFPAPFFRHKPKFPSMEKNHAILIFIDIKWYHHSTIQ